MDYILGGESALGLAAQTARQIIELGTERTQPKDFDYQTKDYSIDTTITDDYKNGYNGNLVSELGTPVYSEVTFGNASWQTENTSSFYGINGQFIINKPPVITFQAILCSVVFPRNIVKTEIQGLDGTVKEYIGEGDAQISFRGVITGKNGQRPKDIIQQFIQLVKAPVSVPVVSDYLNNDMGIWSVVFDERSFEQEEGGYSYQGFLVNALSDNPIELHLS